MSKHKVIPLNFPFPSQQASKVSNSKFCRRIPATPKYLQILKSKNLKSDFEEFRKWLLLR